ncbi:MAG: PBSX family phage terminase large subunit [Bacillota bacterium]|nr:PBSX family phage terminase large subunit [Bacillota bacterium]
MAKTIRIQSNPIFKPVHQSKHRYVAMLGSAGSGKSYDTAQQYILRLMQDKGRNLLAVRKAEVTNRDSTFAELYGAINRSGFAPYWQATVSPLMLRCVNGNSILFRGMNDERQREKLKSISFAHGKLTDVWIEEATEITQPDFEVIDDRLRGDLPAGLFYQIKMTFNPVSKAHWIKRVFFDYPDPNVLTHKSTYRDNRFIDKAYYQRMERRRIVDPDGYQVYGLGEWGEVGGLILSNWQVEEISQERDHFDSLTYGQDFGFNHANAILELGHKDGEINVLREIYEIEKTTTELIAIANRRGLYRSVPMWCDSAEPDRIKMWKQAGYSARPVKKYPGSVSAQIDVLRQHRIRIHPSCVNTLKEIGQWKYRRDERTGLYLEEPVEYMDDAMAALRYGVEPLRRPKGKPADIDQQVSALRRFGL